MTNKKKSMTVRLTEQEFKEIKIKLINDGKSFQEYIMELIKSAEDVFINNTPKNNPTENSIITSIYDI